MQKNSELYTDTKEYLTHMQNTETQKAIEKLLDNFKKNRICFHIYRIDEMYDLVDSMIKQQ
jgi:hypothetical protein